MNPFDLINADFRQNFMVYLADDHVRIDDPLRRATSQPETIEPNAYAEFRVRLRKHIGLEEKVTISPCEFVVSRRDHASMRVC
jgi:hypothetical protein